MNNLTQYITNHIKKISANKNIPSFKAGDTVRIYNTIIENNNKRTQVFEGHCLAIYKKGVASSCRIKKITKNTVFEKIFPMYSPLVEKIQVIKRGKVRRAKLYYMRTMIGKLARIKEKRS